MNSIIGPYGTFDLMTQREISEVSGQEKGYIKKLFH